LAHAARTPCVRRLTLSRSSSRFAAGAAASGNSSAMLKKKWLVRV